MREITPKAVDLMQGIGERTIPTLVSAKIIPFIYSCV
jgi:hypothetical protein